MSGEQGPPEPQNEPRNEPRDETAGHMEHDMAAPERTWSQWRTPIILFVLTCASTLWVGATMEGVASPDLQTVWQGWTFAVPLLMILVAHEMGHYVAGIIHKVDISPPYFIPMPISLLGTMGAVIRMNGRIRSRDALLDIGASGPIAGMVVALPVLIYGLIISPVEPMDLSAGYIAEGHSILYSGLLYLLKGPIPDGHDIMLSSPALAGWAGLLVTMINMIPFGQLDGGHVAYALLGKKQNKISRLVVWILPALAVVVSLAYGIPSYLAGDPEHIIEGNFWAGASWAVWTLMLLFMTRAGAGVHPPTDDGVLSPKRRMVAIGTLIMFVLLFMPAMIRSFTP